MPMAACSMAWMLPPSSSPSFHKRLHHRIGGNREPERFGLERLLRQFQILDLQHLIAVQFFCAEIP